MAGNSRGARLEATWETLQLDVALLNLGQRYDLLSHLADSIKNQSQERFETQRAPDGQPWQQWSEIYSEKVQAAGNPKHSLLHRTGALRDSIASQIFSPDSAVIGSKLSYAKIQNYGGISEEGWRIPARPFLGLGEKDKLVLEGLTSQWVQRAVSNA